MVDSERERIAVLLLAGGRNSRMNGLRKADLVYGGETFLTRIAAAFQEAGLMDIFLSVANGASWPPDSFPLVTDEVGERGPLGGIVSGFHAVCCDALFVCATDLPCVNRKIIETVYERWSTDPDRICAAETRDSIHPLFAIYPRRILPLAERMLAEGDLRMMHLLKEGNAVRVRLDDDAALFNVNSPQDYRALTDPRLICVCGAMGSGKTALLEMLVPEMTARGYRVAVIKHDGHDFDCDLPGTDSFRFMQAGAYGTAVYSPNRIFLHRTEQDPTLAEVTSCFPGADVIFVEGEKGSRLPKIETVRAGEKPISNPEGRFLIVRQSPAGLADRAPDEFTAEEVLRSGDIAEIADLVESVLLRRGRTDHRERKNSGEPHLRDI